MLARCRLDGNVSAGPRRRGFLVSAELNYSAYQKIPSDASFFRVRVMPKSLLTSQYWQLDLAFLANDSSSIPYSETRRGEFPARPWRVRTPLWITNAEFELQCC